MKRKTTNGLTAILAGLMLALGSCGLVKFSHTQTSAIKTSIGTSPHPELTKKEFIGNYYLFNGLGAVGSVGLACYEDLLKEIKEGKKTRR